MHSYSSNNSSSRVFSRLPPPVLQAELVAKGERVPEHLKVPLPAPGPRGALGAVLERSRALCLLRYEKELLRPGSWLALLGKIEAPLNEEQTAVFAGGWVRPIGRIVCEPAGHSRLRCAVCLAPP